MSVPDGMDKSWERPWTTEEMRNKRREWSLAGDAGLLKHLQQFSENLVSKANKTQEAIDSLSNQLSETAIFIDNVTNTSLALANTQFIESRVQEDDVEIKKEENSQQNSEDQEVSTTDLIASVSESIKQGLSIVEERYKEMEVVDSDSEDEGDSIVLSVILEPRDPYQDRPLPYVIGSDKWKASSKIGLESSSSESEQVEEESESDDNREPQQVFDMNKGPKVNIARLSSSSSESDQSHEIYMNNGKLDNMSQDTMNFISDSTTPISNVPKIQLSSEAAPNFAEELAKRLGNVRQFEKPSIVGETKEPSINRLKDDMFTADDKPDELFGDNKQLFDVESSNKLWKSQPTFQSNIIPPSMDMPPPMTTISTKPKSAIDDLFADADSEDSDDIFSSKKHTKKTIKNAIDDDEKQSSMSTENVQKKFLDVLKTKTACNMTSTPESNANNSNLFSDEEDDGDDLFSTTKNQSHKSVESKNETSPDHNKKKPVGGVSVLGGILTSSVQNELSNRIPRRESSNSSNSDTTANNDNGLSNEALSTDQSQNAALADTPNGSSIIAAGRIYYAENPDINIGQGSNSSSGIFVQPYSISNTLESNTGTDTEPRMASTRLNSEEIFRERVASDSLFTAQPQNPVPPTPANSANSSSSQVVAEQRMEEGYSVRFDDVFENEDLFGPPPLPKADSKASKSKVSSLFDDSDSGDELFSTTSSGSRSQKSTDFLAVTPQYPEKSRFTSRKSFFDDDVDIFSNNNDSPGIDIFGTASKSNKEAGLSVKGAKEVSSDSISIGKDRSSVESKEKSVEKVPTVKPVTKERSLFDDEDDGDDGDLFGTKAASKMECKVESKIFADDLENDLFSTKKIDKEEVENKKSLSKEGQIDAPKMEENLVQEEKSIPKELPEKGSSSFFNANGSLLNKINARESLFDDEDDDDLFGKKNMDRDRRDDEVMKKEVKFVTAASDVKRDIEVDGDSSPFKDSLQSMLISNSGEERKNNVVGEKVEEEKENVKSSEMANDGAVDAEFKKQPPKTLNIRTSVDVASEEDTQVSRRAVSGKIKDLMGKMGDFKILSPTDMPPSWRKSEEKTDEDDTADRDSDDGGVFSTPNHSPPAEDNLPPKQSLVSEGTNVETAISFDLPAQVETLSTATSKSRVRIQAKRRPQSRHARKSALRHSGIDFDTVDVADKNVLDENPEFSTDSTIATAVASSMDRLSSSTLTADANQRNVDLNVSTADDKSEYGSISKESSVSANKNTLLSPSTDEEDLFDVPPDLPEDSQKEDTLFGRAPILSPIERIFPERESSIADRSLRDTIISRTDEDISDDDINTVRRESVRSSISAANLDTTFIAESATQKVETSLRSKRFAEDELVQQKKFMMKQKNAAESSKNVESDIFEEPIDPLRDNSRDPLEDPSQLFAFVTKTPSPEKGKNLLFSEDDSLFSSGPKKAKEQPESRKKEALDLFTDDDVGGDLFSAPLVKSVKKPLKDTKIGLFDEDTQNTEDDNLFASVSDKVKKNEEDKVTSKRNKLFDDDDDDDDYVDSLFVDQPPQMSTVESTKVPQRSTKSENTLLTGEATKSSKRSSGLTDIFGDQSSTEDDIFSSVKAVPKKTTVTSSKSLFSTDSDEDDGEIFGKTSSFAETKTTIVDSGAPLVKKSVTRDLKKTAEKIVEDPLSLLRED